MSSSDDPRREAVEALFASHRRRRHLIDHAFENGAGSITVDDEDSPTQAVLTVGRVTVLAGDAAMPAARDLVQGLPPTIVTPEDRRWHDLVCEVHGDRVDSYRRVDFSSASLAADHLRALSESAADLRIEPLDGDLVERLSQHVGDGFFGKFPSTEAFLRLGFGFCGVVEDRVACGATSGVICRRGISVQIQTAIEFQRRGFATAVGARLILESLERGIDPHWSAANAPSADLAEKLGYVREDEFDDLVVMG